MDRQTIWTPEHFVGGHPGLDLANAVYDRYDPPEDNELFRSPRDLGHWLLAAGLVDAEAAGTVGGVESGQLVEDARAIRECSHAVFDAVAAGSAIPTQPLGRLFAQAANGWTGATVGWQGARPQLAMDQWRDARLVVAFLAHLPIEAFFTLPRERLHACPRCGWLFVDTSRGGRRRWCNMRVCGNREKVSRHRAG